MVQATDGAGNTVTRMVTYNVVVDEPTDTTPPVISSIAMDKPHYRVTQDPTVAVTVVEDNTADVVKIDGVNATEGAAGTWTYSFNHSGVNGTYSILVQATDAAGSEGPRH